jgi:hypothetical protein
MSQIDLEALKGEIGRVLKESVTTWVQGASDDLEAYSQTILKLMVRAAKTGSADALEHVKAQVALLAEMQRLRANAAALRTLEIVADTLVRVLIGAGRLSS